MEDYLAIHEYHEPGGIFQSPAWTREPIDVGGSSISDLRRMLHAMIRALDKPILDYQNDPDPET